MRRLVHAARAGDWPPGDALGSLTLGFADRSRRRTRLETDGGAPVLLDLPQPAALAEGDGLAFADGGWLLVVRGRGVQRRRAGRIRYTRHMK